MGFYTISPGVLGVLSEPQRPVGPENPSEARMLVDDLLLQCPPHSRVGASWLRNELQHIRAAILKLEQRP